MTEHDQGKGVGARRDTPAAVGDDLLALGSDGCKALAKLARWQELVGFRIEQMRCGQVDAALDVTGPPIGVAAGAGVLLRQ